MTRPAAPSMPTPRQIREAAEAVLAICPGAVIERVGPEGVTFRYPGAEKAEGESRTWDGSFG